MKYLIIGLLILLAVLLGVFYPQLITVDNNHLFWLSSTIVQGFVALVSLLGMVGIFKLQYVNNEKERLAEILRDKLVYYRALISKTYSTEEAIKEAKDVMLKITGESIIEKTVSTLEGLLYREKNIRKSINEFVTYTLIVVFIALCSLVFTPLITKYSLGITILIILIALSAYSLFLAIRLVKSML